MTKFFYDCEFLENGRTIDLISIGIVREDGKEYYAVNWDANWIEVVKHEWLRENVVPYLPQVPMYKGAVASPDLKSYSQIANEVREFLLASDGEPEFWAWYGAFDHVALAWLWGPMSQLPDGLPKYTRDLKQECDRLGNPTLPKQTDMEHHALADARWNRIVAAFLEDYERRSTS